MSGATDRKTGITIDAARLDYEMGRRGINARQLAEAAELPEATLSRARHGRPVAERTFRRLAKGLLGIPLLVGAELLVAEPEKKIAAGSVAAAIEEVTSANGHARRAV